LLWTLENTKFSSIDDLKAALPDTVPNDAILPTLELLAHFRLVTLVP
jgi:hypothetical protein